MTTTFLKRQKEMKRMEKQREKAERRAQRKLAKITGIDMENEAPLEGVEETDVLQPDPVAPQN